MSDVNTRATETEQTEIEPSTEQELPEMTEDPDEGLSVQGWLRKRLLRQKRAVAAGERGESLDEVVQRLGILFFFMPLACF